MINRHRLLHLLRHPTPEREVVTSTRRQSPLRPGSKLLQHRSALLARHQRH
jgi:hypothetical protein